MRKRKGWVNTKLLLVIWLMISPVLVTAIQVAALDFPKYNIFFSTVKYNPWSQVLSAPIILGIIGSIIFISFDHFTKILIERQIKKAFTIPLSLIVIILLVGGYWLGLTHSQRWVIFEYYSAINVNGLHFFEMLVIPFFPEIFPPYDRIMPTTSSGLIVFSAIMLIGIIGITIITFYCYGLLRRIGFLDYGKFKI